MAEISSGEFGGQWVSAVKIGVLGAALSYEPIAIWALSIGWEGGSFVPKLVRRRTSGWRCQGCWQSPIEPCYQPEPAGRQIITMGVKRMRNPRVESINKMNPLWVTHKTKDIMSPLPGFFIHNMLNTWGSAFASPQAKWYHLCEVWPGLCFWSSNALRKLNTIYQLWGHLDFKCIGYVYAVHEVQAVHNTLYGI